MQPQINTMEPAMQQRHFQAPVNAPTAVAVQGPQPLDLANRQTAIDELLNKIELVQEVMRKVMREGEHFGKIPGCGDKPALFKSGAEKLAMTFRLKAKPHIDIVDLGRGHREYRVSIELSDGSTGTGSCSTLENKYRYRQGERRCPACGMATILKSKKEGEGWFCWTKKGGCGAQFAADSEDITGQLIGKVEHDNPADFYNTCLQMADKRAFVQSIRRATACSDIFMESPDDDPEPGPAGGAGKRPEGKTETQPATVFYQSVKVVTVSDPKKGNGGKPAWLLTFNTGERQIDAWTYDPAAAGLAKELIDTHERASVEIYQANEKGWALKVIQRAEQP